MPCHIDICSSIQGVLDSRLDASFFDECWDGLLDGIINGLLWGHVGVDRLVVFVKGYFFIVDCRCNLV